MALQLPWDAHGVTFPDCYAAVSYSKSRRSGEALVILTIYTNDTKQHPLDSVPVHFTLDKGGDNIHTQAYQAAKLLPEFADAVDV